MMREKTLDSARQGLPTFLHAGIGGLRSFANAGHGLGTGLLGRGSTRGTTPTQVLSAPWLRVVEVRARIARDAQALSWLRVSDALTWFDLGHG